MNISLLHLLALSLILTILPFFNDIAWPILSFNIFTLFYYYLINSQSKRVLYSHFFSSIFCFKQAKQKNKKQTNIATWFKFLLLTINLLLIIKIYGYHINQDISIVLLISMLCLKLLEIKDQNDKRNISIIIYLQIFLIAASFLSSQGIGITLYNIFLVLCLSLLMILFSRVPIPLQLKSIKPLIKINLKMALLAIPLTITLFLLFPRIPGPLWSLPNLNTQGTTGLSDTMFPGSVNKLSDSTEIVFRIDFKGDIPKASKLYWRGPVLSKTDGFLWEKSEYSDKKLKQKFSTMIQNISQPIEYTISLEPQKQNWLFSLEMPKILTSQFVKDAYLSQDMQYLVKDTISRVVQYQVLSYTSFHFSANQPSNKLEVKQALNYPIKSNPKTWQLGQQWKKQITSPQEIINTGLQYFIEKDFYYTRKPRLMAKNPADEFLFTYKRGFCEHFASSFVLLMRASGIPARVVTGYQGMEYNKIGDYYLVRQSNAHAWAEVWLKDNGWVRIDPTSIIPQDHIEADIFDYKYDEFSFLNLNYSDILKLQNKIKQSNWFEQAIKTAKQSMDIIQYSWNNWILAYDQNKQNGLLKWLGLNSNWQQLAILLIAIPIIILVIIIYFQLYRKAKNKDKLLQDYQQVLLQLEKKGLVISPNLGPETIKKQSIMRFPQYSKELKIIFDYYIYLRYSKASKYYSLKGFRQIVKENKKILY